MSKVHAVITELSSRPLISISLSATLDSITKLEKMCRDESIHFYNFVQNPYPEPIYNFVLDSDTFVLRFGFDNGCDIDSHAVKKDIITSTKESLKNYIIMVTSNDIYIMDEL